MKALEATAYHEAGHAVAAYVLRRRVRYVTIVPEGDSQGRIVQPPLRKFTPDDELIRPWGEIDRHTRRWAEREIIVDFAGAIAEAKARGRHNWRGSTSDLQDADDLIMILTGSPEEANAYARWLWERAKNLVTSPVCWPSVEALAAALLEERYVGGRKARQIIRHAMEARAVLLRRMGDQQRAKPAEKRQALLSRGRLRNITPV